jgi:hypothetical protein
MQSPPFIGRIGDERPKRRTLNDRGVSPLQFKFSLRVRDDWPQLGFKVVGRPTLIVHLLTDLLDATFKVFSLIYGRTGHLILFNRKNCLRPATPPADSRQTVGISCTCLPLTEHLPAAPQVSKRARTLGCTAHFTRIFCDSEKTVIQTFRTNQVTQSTNVHLTVRHDSLPIHLTEEFYF